MAMIMAMNTRVAGAFLLAAGVCLLFEDGGRVLAAACMVAAALPLLLPMNRMGRLSVDQELVLQQNGRDRAALVSDPGTQFGRTSLLVQSGPSPISDVLNASVMLDTWEAEANVCVLTEGTPAVSMNVEGDGWRGLVVRDQQGRTRLLAGVDPDGRPSLSIRDPEGRETVLACARCAG